MARATTLATPRLLLEPFGRHHLTERYVSWLNDPQVVQFSDQRFRTHTLVSCREYYETFGSSPHLFWAILLRGAADRHVGTMTAYVDEHHKVADVGILIGDGVAWGRGSASEALRAACDHLLRQLELRKVTAGTIERNVGMIRVMEKAGMVDDGRRQRQLLWNGCEVDVVHKALFREAWLELHPESAFERSDQPGRRRR